MKIQFIGIVEWRILQKSDRRVIVWNGEAERVTLPYVTNDHLTEGFHRVGLFGISALNGR